MGIFQHWAAVSARIKQLLTPALLSVWLMGFLHSPLASAVDAFSITVGNIQTSKLNLQDLRIDLKPANPQFNMSISQLSLPKRFPSMRRISLRCETLLQQSGLVACKNGQAQLRMENLPALSSAFGLILDRDQWDFKLSAAKIPGQYLGLLPLPTPFNIENGLLDVNLSASGKNTDIQTLQINGHAENLTGQSQDSRYAVEKLNLQGGLSAQIRNHEWHWRSHAGITNGALYADPIYLEASAGLSLDSAGSWLTQKKQWAISFFNYQDGQAAKLTGKALLEGDIADIKVKSATLAFHSQDLGQLAQTYLNPFVAQSAWDGLAPSGQMSTQLTIADHHLADWTMALTDIGIDDSKARIGLTGGSGIINGSATGKEQASYLAWRKLALGPLPVGASLLAFSAQANGVRLLKQAVLPFLGGRITIERLAWQKKTEQTPEIRFAGKLADVSLGQLSQVLGWPSLSGNISGDVPGVDYSDGVLKLNGGLVIQAFAGNIGINNLAVSGLLSDFPTLYADLTLDRLNLDQLTQKFRFGAITGQLSGFVRQLYLENWRPISFFAWLGTPEDDSSPHRISQTAVKNIASISGNSASDIVTQGLLGFFDNFSYDKIGLGCYLNNGVCQLMGIAPANGGYSIVSGGGLPRIDVVGYNPKIDWAVLINRLRRITATDEIIIK